MVRIRKGAGCGGGGGFLQTVLRRGGWTRCPSFSSEMPLNFDHIKGQESVQIGGPLT